MNILLFIAKVVAFALSRSFSVLASAADSFVDLSSQVQVWHCYLSSWGPAPECIASLRALPAGCACTSDLAHAQGGPQIPHRKDSPGDSCRDHLCRWVFKKSTALMWSMEYYASIPKGLNQHHVPVLQSSCPLPLLRSFMKQYRPWLMAWLMVSPRTMLCSARASCICHVLPLLRAASLAPYMRY